MNFVDKLWSEYPLPKEASIWLGDGVNTTPLKDLTQLIESCVDELSSDILITEYQTVYSMTTKLPEDTVLVNSAKLQYAFQGNRYVKTTFDVATKVVNIRYFPATITYKRLFRVSDLESLKGDRLIFVKSYVLWKMCITELQMLKTINLNTDNSDINLDSLSESANNFKSQYEELKKEILIYSTSN